MNKAKVLTLANAIEAGIILDRETAEPIGFNMDTYKMYVAAWPALYKDQSKRGCNTVCCLAGSARELWPEVNPAPGDEAATFRRAQAALGLTTSEAASLFKPTGIEHRWHKVTASKAVRVLRHLAKTGRVDWSIR